MLEDGAASAKGGAGFGGAGFATGGAGGFDGGAGGGGVDEPKPKNFFMFVNASEIVCGYWHEQPFVESNSSDAALKQSGRISDVAVD